MRDVLEHRHLLAGPRRRPEVELHHLALLRQLDLLDLVERLHAALHLRRLGGVGGEPVDEPLLFRQHRLLPGVGRLAVRVADRPLALVEVVVPRVHRDLAVVDLGDLRHDAVHEVAVVRGHQQRAGARFQEAFEPDDRLDVEMVGRLVHQQDVGLAEQHARHRHAHLPAAGQRADVAVDPLVVEPEAVEHFAGLRLERVAAEVLVLLLHFAEAREDGVHLAGPIRIAHRVIELLELVMQIADAAAAENRLVEHRAARHLLDVLAEIADRQLLRDRHVAFVGDLLAGDQPEQRGLSGSVRADQADFLSRIELERGVDEEELAAVLLADAGQRDHAEALRVYCVAQDFSPAWWAGLKTCTTPGVRLQV